MIKAKLQDVKRTLILEEAAKGFETAGYEQLKVSDLAKRVGVSVGTIYGMFESKEGLYMAYIRAQIAAYLEELERRSEGMDDPVEQLALVFRIKFEHFARKRRAIEECAKNNPLFFSNLRQSEPEILEAAYAKITSIIQNVRPDLDTACAEQLAYLFSSLSDGYISYWLKHDGDLLAQLPKLRSQMVLLIKGTPCDA